ncbi:MAG TPA: protein-glutamate O-methyltransferase CheR [Burkholderiales bacterium]|nr:protein-glutamate O-methyltransferase CheR [Burkholderiales bacterium]
MIEKALIGEILAIVRARTGIDFAAYRAPTLERRILSRMGSVGIASHDEYLRLLERSHEEAAQLLERITIKVSRFYRHVPTFDLLRAQVMPRLAALGRPVRAWSAGCGRGEEPYTLAMLLDEASIEGRVEATDIDPRALELALAGEYAAEAVAELPRELRERYLEAAAGGRKPTLRVRASLRERVRFSRGDLRALDAAEPGGGFDLVCCRNVLIYWLPEVQARVLAAVLAAVAPGGYLCLGEAEWPRPQATAGLQPLTPGGRVFRAAA